MPTQTEVDNFIRILGRTMEDEEISEFDLAWVSKFMDENQETVELFKLFGAIQTDDDDPFITGIIDPDDHFDVPGEELIEQLGLVPTICAEALMEPEAPLEEALEKAYGFPLHYSSNGIVASDNTYSYPGDPTLYPMVIYISAGKQINCYEHGITAFRENINQPFKTIILN
jgi:hypothetical protein